MFLRFVRCGAVISGGGENVIAGPLGAQIKLGRLVHPVRKAMTARVLPTLPLPLTLTRFQILWRRPPRQSSSAVISGEDHAQSASELANERVTLEADLADTADEIAGLVG